MRWVNKFPAAGDERVVETFLLLPREIGGETRWLERARIRQVYELRFPFTRPQDGGVWKDVAWEGESCR